MPTMGNRPTTKNRTCCSNLSKKQKFVIFHILDSIFLLAVQLVQGFVLNYYISTDKNEQQYFLYGLDIFCSLVFITALFSSYQYLSYYIDNNEYPDKRYVASPKRIVPKFPTSKLGVLPLSYLSWVIYVLILLLKIQIIFGADLFVNLNKHNSFAPQLLKMMIGLSSLVFLLLVEAHNRLELNSERYKYVTTICSKVGVEIFDSVSLLSVLLLGDQVPPPFEHIVCILAGINFLLPTLSLYRLSLSDSQMTQLNDKIPVQLFSHLSRTALIEIPFLTVRLFLWISYKEEASMFMMKNIFNILVTLRTVHPELVTYLNRDNTQSAETVELDAPLSQMKAVPYIPHYEAV